jgi:LemA protein
MTLVWIRPSIQDTAEAKRSGEVTCCDLIGACATQTRIDGIYTRTMIWLWVVLAVVVIGGVVIYNGLVQTRNRVDNAWAQIDVQLKRRYDLIPNLVETVKGYASHERETFERVTQARSAAQSASGPAEQAQAEGFLTQALRQLFAVAEAYPELRASENFQGLQAELSETENKIAVSRQIYNDTVLTYNNKVQQVPTNFVASLTGFKVREFFEAGPEAAEAPVVDF